jgi:hypothetical protein
MADDGVGTGIYHRSGPSPEISPGLGTERLRGFPRVKRLHSLGAPMESHHQQVNEPPDRIDYRYAAVDVQQVVRKRIGGEADEAHGGDAISPPDAVHRDATERSIQLDPQAVEDPLR